jgi:hypothetical protein
MEHIQKFPKLNSVILNREFNNNDPYTDYLFNPNTNKGYSVNGLAALFCRELNGTKSLAEVITNFENQYELAPGIFINEIEKLIIDLEKNQLIEFLNTPAE